MIADFEALTPREQELVACLMVGLTTTSQIASAMTVSHNTVHGHIATVFRKLGVNNRTQLVSHAWRNGTLEGNRWRANA